MRRVFRILSVNISEKKGEQKKPVSKAILKENFGIEGDAHAGNWHRQISLLANEDIETMRAKGIKLDYGDFAENITTKGIDLANIPVGTRLYLGNAIIEITQIGKSCHHDCAIYQAVGDCVMPRKGVFAKVIKGGEISLESYSFCEIC
ncbi:MAG: MOSC domain-containing protein [Candidatus Cloacimonadota bacterium]|nr:MAG: MOSC domain-containing protein [Candidatus Cloacimonadota bacterium]